MLPPTKEIQEFKALDKPNKEDEIKTEFQLIERYLNQVYIPKYDSFGTPLSLSMRVNRLVTKYIGSIEERIELLNQVVELTIQKDK